MTARDRVLHANTEFYATLRSGDFARMDEMWSSDEDVSVTHPNWDQIDGREDVMASWFQVMVVAEPPQVEVADECVIVNGRRAFVLCTEVIGSARMFSSNLFVCEADNRWRLTEHRSTQLPEAAPSHGEV